MVTRRTAQPPTDLVVVLPGIMGSTLRRGDDLVWAPSAGAILRTIFTLAGSIEALKLPVGIGDAYPDDGVEPHRLMPDVHALPGIWTPVKGYDVLLDRLRAMGYREGAPGNLLPVPYDWRLSNRRTAAWLGTIVEPALDRWRGRGGPYADAQLVFVCHSMGGLVARWYIEQCGGADHTRKLITLGTPYRGAAKALTRLANGMAARTGPVGRRITEFARSLPSIHQLLPEYACVVRGDDLAKTTELTLPVLSPAMVADGMAFHDQLRAAEAGRPSSLGATHAIVGTGQPTATTVQISDDRIVELENYRGDELFGDSTVPLVAAARADVAMDSNTLRRVPDKHGNLHRNPAALDELEGILTARDIVVRAAGQVELRVGVADLHLAGETIALEIEAPELGRGTLRVVVRDESDNVVHARVLKLSHTRADVTFDPLPPGAYTFDVSTADVSTPVAPVSAPLLVWGEPSLP